MTACYRHDSQGLHCQLMLFLTAELQALAQLEGAKACSPPSPSGLGFLVGEKACLREP
ncbi:hypothetical protein PVT67_03510 [Gallaecimonas kandeliae]|uniref:hypothetical protein n=1 Tax=Gallaecimonas kandeliae TaxID=3029055 RepID=UPI002647F243|nr:hypothetical protein [Gallaecimonas kandeliae]WKE66330.1 hypothetical protein PVT67_03510 [Gallaecimonas kandeliae]